MMPGRKPPPPAFGAGGTIPAAAVGEQSRRLSLLSLNTLALTPRSEKDRAIEHSACPAARSVVDQIAGGKSVPSQDDVVGGNISKRVVAGEAVSLEITCSGVDLSYACLADPILVCATQAGLPESPGVAVAGSDHIEIEHAEPARRGRRQIQSSG